METSTHKVRIGRDHRLELLLPELPEGVMVRVTVEMEPPVTAWLQRRMGSAIGLGRSPSFVDPLEEFECEKY